MCAWITLDKPNREHIFSHFLCHRKGISLAARKGFNSSRNIEMTRIFWWLNCSVQSLGHVWLFATPWTSACQASLSFILFRSLLKLMSIESVMPSSHLILCHLLLPLPSIFPSIRGFSNELPLHIIDSELLPRLAFQVRESCEAQPPWTLNLSLGRTETLRAVPIYQARKF